MRKHSAHVVTWQSSGGETMDICRTCERRLDAEGDWPKDRWGNELCSVSRGEHTGICDFDQTGGDYADSDDRR